MGRLRTSDVYYEYISYDDNAHYFLQLGLVDQQITQVDLDDVQVKVEGTQHVVVPRLAMIDLVLVRYVGVVQT